MADCSRGDAWASVMTGTGAGVDGLVVAGGNATGLASLFAVELADAGDRRAPLEAFAVARVLGGDAGGGRERHQADEDDGESFVASHLIAINSPFRARKGNEEGRASVRRFVAVLSSRWR
ncbi:hypothetical protein Cni_G18183 [Canna indica]|uniref:Uncharacterized protein n=1 Tax=Canna indica TaxID=4628 RepID=A0AAQ3KIV2_9LILI|nr:hypothetical protein Cni_G18183 [Canna indica]